MIHHSHTDIGYTERQEKIERYHYNFIIQAINILNDIHSGILAGCEGFIWQCENYWQVQNFYSFASAASIADFEKYVVSGEIGLSGNYLNMTELVDEYSLNSRLEKSETYAANLDIKIESGMSADINGFSWGYVDALYEHGIRNFFSCLHPHHGMFPLNRKVMPFNWESPKGNTVLFWNGEHYHFGNELFLAPFAGNSYMELDEYYEPFNTGMLFSKNRESTEKQELEILDTRLSRYLANLEIENYEYDFVPVMVSGALTDNGFPNPDVAKRINQLNHIYAGQIEFEMVTLDGFFNHLRENIKQIPTFKGDWNDWWADGVGSTPLSTKLCKDAQRKLGLCRKLDPDNILGNANLVEKATENIMLYSEHTWGYSASVSDPFDTLVSFLDLKKSAYATNANTEISFNLDEILAKKGEHCISYRRSQNFKVINPNDFEFCSKVLLYVEHWEYLEGVQFNENTQFELVDRKTEMVLPHQMKRIARAFEIETVLSLKSNEERELYLRLCQHPKHFTIRNHPHIGAERVRDLVEEAVYEINTSKIETDFFIIDIDQQKGIISIIDKKTKKNIVKDNTEYSPFNGIYEITDMHEDPIGTRRKMGRNRKNEETLRYEGVLVNLRIVENGDVYALLKMDYQLEGTQRYSVFFKVYKSIPQLESLVQIHKDCVWEPENLYISLPFEIAEKQETYIDKTGCIIRPGIDQLPGTNKEFYLLQNGIVYANKQRSLILAIKDTPLVTFGSLQAKPIRLCQGDDTEFNNEAVYSWAMNNYWETNFKVDLSGFYEFTYTLRLEDTIAIQHAFNYSAAINTGFIGFYS